MLKMRLIKVEMAVIYIIINTRNIRDFERLYSLIFISHIDMIKRIL